LKQATFCSLQIVTLLFGRPSVYRKNLLFRFDRHN